MYDDVQLQKVQSLGDNRIIRCNANSLIFPTFPLPPTEVILTKLIPCSFPAAKQNLSLYISLSGGFCQSPPLRRSRSGLPVQHAVCVSAVGSDLQTGQDPGGVSSGSPSPGDGPAGTDRPGAQYPVLCLSV